MTHDQFDILCKLAGLHAHAHEMREYSRKVFVDGMMVKEAAKGRGATFYRGLWSQVKRLEKTRDLADLYHVK
jgi:hypothetical protein